jgi:hypothetical protein
MSRLDLNPQASGYFHGYSSVVDASIANSFAAAAFRFGHTLLPVSSIPIPFVSCYAALTRAQQPLTKRRLVFLKNITAGMARML